MKTFKANCKPFIFSITMLCLISCGGGSSDNNGENVSNGGNSNNNTNTTTAEEGLQKIANNLVDNVFIPSFLSMQQSNVNLGQALNMYCDKASAQESDLDTLKSAWQDTNNKWQIARIVKLGALSDNFAYSRVQFWPDTASKVQNDVEAFLLSNDNFDTDFDLQKHRLQGLPVIEYLLFNSNEVTHLLNAEDKNRRCQLMNAVVKNIETIMSVTLSDWNSGFGNDFKTGQGAVDSHKDALEKFLTVWFEYLEIINDNKLKDVIGDAAPGKPFLLESAFANESIKNIKTNIVTLEQLFNGGSGYGFDDYLSEVNNRADVKEEIALHFNGINNAFDELNNEQLITLISTDEGRAKLSVLRTSITDLRALMSSDFVQVTDLAPGFNTNDGD